MDVAVFAKAIGAGIVPLVVAGVLLVLPGVPVDALTIVVVAAVTAGLDALVVALTRNRLRPGDGK